MQLSVVQERAHSILLEQSASPRQPRDCMKQLAWAQAAGSAFFTATAAPGSTQPAPTAQLMRLEVAAEGLAPAQPLMQLSVVQERAHSILLEQSASPRQPRDCMKQLAWAQAAG